MRSVNAVGLIAALSLFAGAVNAEILRHTYFGVMVQGFDPDPSRGAQIEEGLGVDVWLGHELYPRWYFEGHVFSNVFETGAAGGADLYQSGVNADLMYTMYRRGQFTPFVVGGVGFAYDDVVPNERDSGNFFASAGVGVVGRAVGPAGLRLRIEARATYDDFEYSNTENGVYDYRAGIGIEIPIAAAEMVIREVPVPVTAPPGPRPDGYPARPAMAGTDSDGDGVLDNFDRCPNTLPGSIVDRSGCIGDEQTVAVLYGVHFEFARTRLLPDARTILDSAARAFKGQPNLAVDVVGHADSRGSSPANAAISRARAQAVVDYLAQHGVNPARLNAIGVGNAEPVAPNTTDMGRWENRRVEFRLRTTQ